MTIYQDFTSGEFTLVFDAGLYLRLNAAETKEFQEWFDEKSREAFAKRGDLLCH